MKFYKVWKIYSWVYLGHKCGYSYNEARVIPLPDTFYLRGRLHMTIGMTTGLQTGLPTDRRYFLF